MNDFGELLYEGQTDTNKNGFGFILVGIILFVGANFIYAKTMLMIVAGVFVLIGLYLLIFKRSESFFIYENTIMLSVKGQAIPIAKEEISHIEYHELKARRSPVINYYPVLVLKDQRQVLINKAFNAVVNQNFKKIIESYM